LQIVVEYNSPQMGEKVDYYMYFQVWPVNYKYDPIPYLSFPSHKANCIPLIVILASFICLVHSLNLSICHLNMELGFKHQLGLVCIILLLPQLCTSQDSFTDSRATYYGSPDCYGTPSM